MINVVAFLDVVEMLAAGLATVAHRSGGNVKTLKLEDQGISEACRLGFLAEDEEEYADALLQVGWETFCM